MHNYAVVFLIIILAAAGAVGAFWLYYLQPVQEERERFEQDIRRLQAQKDEIRGVTDDIARINEEIRKLTVRRSKLQTEANQMTTVVPKLLDSVEAIANKFDVKFEDIRISPLVRAEQWSELPIEIGLLGTFQNIGNFLLVAERRGIINLAEGSISISVSAEVDPKSRSPLLAVTLNPKVYIMGDGR